MPRNHNTSYRGLAAPAALLLASAALGIAGCGGSAARKSPGTLAAVGDSVAAGFGLPASPKASTDDKLCGRSPEAYPAIVAKDLKLRLANVACSGAVAANLSGSQKVKSTTMPAQLEKAFAEGPPKDITMTIGANDANWSGFILDCFGGNICNTATNNNAAKADLAKLNNNLEKDFQLIQDLSANDHVQPPTTVLTGYYEPVSNECNITGSSLAWLQKESDALNTTLENVTQHFSFARFAPVESYFVQHRDCTSESWVQPGGVAPLHPLAEGQKAIAGAVLNALHTN